VTVAGEVFVRPVSATAGRVDVDFAHGPRWTRAERGTSWGLASLGGSADSAEPLQAEAVEPFRSGAALSIKSRRGGFLCQCAP
jgi:hypothetical protein